MNLLIDLLIIFIASVILLCLDFKHPIHFISTGYGGSVLIQSIIIVCLYVVPVFKNGNILGFVFVFLQAALICIYGYRLASFLYVRNKNENYLKSIKPFTLKTPIAIIILVTCSLLYTFMVSPLLLRAIVASMGNAMSICQIIGMIVMACGIYLEALADHQKSEAKKINPNEFCSTGLYKYLRMPNYFGEIVFWTGNYITSWFTSQNWYFIICNFLGYLSIVFIMFHSASRLDLKQRKRYDSNPKFVEYRTTTRILIPLIPLYQINLVKDE